MLAGGRAVRIIDMPAPRTLSRLVRLIGNQQWIRQSAGTVTLNAAVLVENGSSMTIAAPATSGLVLTVRPGVLLAAVSGSALRIAGVHVRASNPDVPDASVPAGTGGGPPVPARLGGLVHGHHAQHI